MEMMMQKPFVRTDIRTPLEKELNVPQPGLFLPDGSFKPTRSTRASQALDGLLDALRANGCKVVQRPDGGLDITPPYPPDANRAERRAIDKDFEARLKRAMNNVNRIIEEQWTR